MKPDLPIEKPFQRTPAVCAALAGLLACWVLLNWMLGQWQLVALGEGHIPMSPSTAGLMLLFSGALFLHSCRPTSRVLVCLAWPAIVLSGAMGLIVFGQSLLGWESPMEQWLTPATAPVMGYPVGRMSPWTAAAYLSLALAWRLVLPSRTKSWWVRQSAAVLALGVLLICLIVILSYAAEVPVLYGGQVIPVPWPTAIGLALLSFGLLLAVGRDTWPLVLFSTGVDESSRPLHWLLGSPLAIFLFLSFSIGLAGFVYLNHQVSAERKLVQNDLKAITDLKVWQISAWYQERRGDAHYFLHAPLFQHYTQEYLNDPTGKETKSHILATMQAIVESWKYHRVLLFDQNGTLQAAFPADQPQVGSRAQSYVTQTLGSGKVSISDLHVSTKDPDFINMDLFVPILPTDAAATGVAKPLGVLMLEIDPHIYLFPLIETWPTPSRTGETLLVRREGNEIIYLNDLRQRENNALNLRIPIDRISRTPAVLAALGREGPLEGVDYRGVPVLAETRGIPGTPWFLETKVDRDEVYAPLRTRAWTTGFILFTLILTAALGVSLLGRRRERHWLQTQLAGDRERQSLSDRFQQMFAKMSSGVVFHQALDDGADFLILDFNPAAERITGLARAAVVGRRVSQAFPGLRTLGLRDVFRRVWQTGVPEFHPTHQYQDQHLVIWTEEYVFRLASGEIVSIFDDITARKHAETALREREETLAALFEDAPVGYHELDATGKVVRANRTLLSLLGYSREEVLGRSGNCTTRRRNPGSWWTPCCRVRPPRRARWNESIDAKMGPQFPPWSITASSMTPRENLSASAPP